MQVDAVREDKTHLILELVAQDLETDLLDVRHLVEALREDLRAVKHGGVRADEGETRHEAAVDAVLAANLEDLRTISRVTELKLLHVDLDAHFRQVVFLVIQGKIVALFF